MLVNIYHEVLSNSSNIYYDERKQTNTRNAKVTCHGVNRCRRWIGLLILFTVISLLLSLKEQERAGAAENTAPELYMGQEPPGFVPKVFGPRLISLPNRYEHSICLSRDGRECYFTVRAANWASSQIMITRLVNGKWTQPVPFFFGNMCPSL